MRQIPAPAEPAAIGLNGLSALVIIMQVVEAAVQRQAWRELLEPGALAAVAIQREIALLPLEEGTHKQALYSWASLGPAVR
jgi:hypothetical protein